MANNDPLTDQPIDRAEDGPRGATILEQYSLFFSLWELLAKYGKLVELVVVTILHTMH